MNILELTHTYPTTDRPWVTPFVGHFCRAMAEEADTEIHVVTPHAAGLDTPGVTFHTFPYSGRIAHKGIGASTAGISRGDQLRFFWQAMRTARHVVGSEKIDLIHAHWSVPSGAVARTVRALTGVPYVVTTHGRDVLDRPDLGYGVPSHPLLGRAVRHVLSSADGVITTSPMTEEAALKISPTARTHRIPVGVDSQLIAGYGPPRGDGIIFIGDLSELKGIDRLIDAIARQPALQAVPVYVLGGGAHRETLQAECASRGLNHVEFVGAVPPDEIPSYLARCRVLVFPSRIEGFGIVLLEALAAGLRIVGSPVGALPMLREHTELQDAVDLIDPDDARAFGTALHNALTAPRPDFAAMNEFIAKRYTWESIAGLYRSYFAEQVRTVSEG